MKRIIRLTEGDLIKLVKRVINEGEEDELEKIFKISRDDYELAEMLISNYDITMDELYQKMVIKILDKLGFIDKEEVRIIDNKETIQNNIFDIKGEFLVYSIKGKNFKYFDDNYLRFQIELEGNLINLLFFNESYSGKEVDFNLKSEIYKYMSENLYDPLFEEGIELKFGYFMWL